MRDISKPNWAIQDANDTLNEAEAFWDWHREFNQKSNVSTAARAVGNAMATLALGEDLKLCLFDDELVGHTFIGAFAHWTGLPAQTVVEEIENLKKAGWITHIPRGKSEWDALYYLTIPNGTDN